MQASTHNDESWTDARAKAKLPEIIERAQSAPQTIIRNGSQASSWSRPKSGRGRSHARVHLQNF